MGIKATLAIALSIPLAGCFVARAPSDLRQQATLKQFRFSQAMPTVKACLVPALDNLHPFTYPPSDTRPPTIRDLGAKTEIFAQDETITLYVIDLEAAGSKATTASLYTTNDRVTEQFDRIARGCGMVNS